ncbi:hypothetical protein NEUTE2DRAFT_156249 [Neurospora tetrasperma FGSC 2509]|nr:hypothetical protein NEUTE2DRAFT_156249 [Neurospora tetrasperma FGSC 2509]
MCNAGSPPYYAVFLISAQLLWDGLCTSANCAKCEGRAFVGVAEGCCRTSERTMRMSDGERKTLTLICPPSQLPSQITMTWTPDPFLTEGILEAEPYRALIGFAPP